jgi:lipoprotein-anchoring transpeptidase ErfK/SrfK
MRKHFPNKQLRVLLDCCSRVPVGRAHASRGEAATRVWRDVIIVCTILFLAVAADAQFGSKPKTGLQPMRSAVDLIKRQAPLQVDQGLLARMSPDDVHIIVSLEKQRAYLMVGEQVVVDSPISSGKRGHTSPSGSMKVLEKDPNHHSSLYGDFVDSSGRIVRAGVSLHIDAAPSGTHFQGAEMKWFMRLTDEGVGMHVGILPGYPASHGCIRMPSDGAKLFYDHVRVGTPVEVQPAA